MPPKGSHHTEEALIKIGLASLGRDNGWLGRHHTEETKQKISQANLGRHHSGEALRHLREGHLRGEDHPFFGTNGPFFGRKHSERTKKQMAASAIGIHCNPSEETRQRMALAKVRIYDGAGNPMYGKTHSEEARQKIREAQLGVPNKPASEETRRRLSEALLGEKHWNWQGGISFEPYPPRFNIKLKRYIRNRDNHICQLCGVPECECLSVLIIHHIDYIKAHIYEENLISLCRSCNAQVNFNREYWQEFFTQLIAKIYAQKGGG